MASHIKRTMNKVPCGGFELGESLIMKDGKLDLVEGVGGAFVVDIVTDGDGAYTLNKTYEEIENAIESGVSVLACVIFSKASASNYFESFTVFIN